MSDDVYVGIVLRKRNNVGHVIDCASEYHVFPTMDMLDGWVDRGCKRLRGSRKRLSPSEGREALENSSLGKVHPIFHKAI